MGRVICGRIAVVSESYVIQHKPSSMTDYSLCQLKNIFSDEFQTTCLSLFNTFQGAQLLV